MTYANRTEVTSEKTRGEIERVLIRYGASEFAYAWRDEEARIAFAMADRRIMFRLPLPDRNDKEFRYTVVRRERRSDAATAEAYEQAVRQRWRALLLIIKAKLEAVEAGIVTLEAEFLAHILLGDGRTVYEQVAPRLALAYERGEVMALLPGASS
jgi:hypothetical protein